MSFCKNKTKQILSGENAPGKQLVASTGTEFWRAQPNDNCKHNFLIPQMKIKLKRVIRLTNCKKNFNNGCGYF